MSEKITEEQLGQLHPIALAIVLRCDEHGQDPKLSLEPEEVVALRESLEAIYGTEELRHAVKNLLALGGVLGQQGCPAISTQILDLLAEEKLLTALDEINDIRERAAEQNSSQFSEFTGKQAPKQAPKPGEQRPEGTLTLDGLKFPKRL
ncbi:MAG: hypothetical protein IPG45_06810 [Deltaproteobacteria bacterium]|nr:hypothetical protein [Deltaproteobacteria bacterium]